MNISSERISHICQVKLSSFFPLTLILRWTRTCCHVEEETQNLYTYATHVNDEEELVRTHILDEVNENWNTEYEIKHFIQMQNDQKNFINMNPSYTLFKLNIRCLKNASWAGNSEWLPYKQEQSWMHSTVFLGSLFHNRHLFMYSAGSFTGKYHCFSNKLKYDWNVADLCQAATVSNCKA